MSLTRAILTITALGLATPLAAQQEQPFSTFQHNPEQPLEIVSDRLGVSQVAQTAEFIGNVEAQQGRLTLRADRMLVTYDGDNGEIERVQATGNVFLTSGTEAAEGAEADYNVSTGFLTMRGDVLLTQGQNALSSEEMRIDLSTGTGEFTGRVRTVFVPTEQQ
ncbi:lipopolysaccharide transport periplasmic protein LptA [Pontivivens ytuae]|uniref:Lipopolysaccharide transport periplasmic protein LptA n=1 Tax=Pontivivens ytuae TaxID=2789856 RepID=A0A7S9LV58_9RHOB|nr:lipopolysaccharide transport periplasmic protein LptA [Pontivivens ytuae]QPH55857.1 lipopolysaccharide transport periplasmic protein LptA [Pontivivens ytuae]